jgi:translation initiation factor 3 subunit C
MEKSKKVIAEQGGIPRFFVRLLCDLEDDVKTALADKNKFKKLSPSNGRALKRMKLTLNKYNKTYAGIMTEYRKDPVVSSADEAESSSSSDSSDDDSDSDSDDSSKKSKKSGKSSSSSSSSGSESGSGSEVRLHSYVRDQSSYILVTCMDESTSASSIG